MPGMGPKLLDLYNATQRHAAVFNGCGLTDNAVLWIGSESGHASTWCDYREWVPEGWRHRRRERDLVHSQRDRPYAAKERHVVLQGGDRLSLARRNGFHLPRLGGPRR